MEEEKRDRERDTRDRLIKSGLHFSVVDILMKMDQRIEKLEERIEELFPTKPRR